MQDKYSDYSELIKELEDSGVKYVEAMEATEQVDVQRKKELEDSGARYAEALEAMEQVDTQHMKELEDSGVKYAEAIEAMEQIITQQQLDEVEEMVEQKFAAKKKENEK